MGMKPTSKFIISNITKVREWFKKVHRYPHFTSRNVSATIYTQLPDIDPRENKHSRLRTIDISTNDLWKKRFRNTLAYEVA